MNNNGKKFEAITESVYKALLPKLDPSQIRRNVLVEGPDGKREIDILIDYSFAGHKCLIAIECRDKRRNITVNEIDAFHSKMKDVRANKGVMVSPKGFSKTAKQKARRCAIDLCVLENIADKVPEIIDNVPVVVCNVAPKNIVLQTGMAHPENMMPLFKQPILINGVNIIQQFVDDFSDGKINIDFDIHTKHDKAKKRIISHAKLETLKPPYLADLAGGGIVELGDYKITYEVAFRWYYGHVDRNSIKHMTNISEGTHGLILDLQEFEIICKSFPFTEDQSKIPYPKDVWCISALFIQNIKVNSIRTECFELDS